jgi:hypothetical protein
MATMTLAELVEKTKEYAPKRVTHLPLIAFDDLKETHELKDGLEVTVVHAVAHSERNPDEVYEVTIEGVGELIDLEATPVKVSCTCQDFYWRFAPWNDENGCLHGAPPEPYEKKTDRKPVNPDHIPGLCKHLLNAVAVLQERVPQ